jgi:hypothetical protein
MKLDAYEVGNVVGVLGHLVRRTGNAVVDGLAVAKRGAKDFAQGVKDGARGTHMRRRVTIDGVVINPGSYEVRS